LPSVRGDGDDDGIINSGAAAASTCIDSNKLTKGFSERQPLESAATTAMILNESVFNQMEQNRPNKDDPDSTFNVMKPLNSHQSHLKINKVPKDELVKIDAEIEIERSFKMGKRARFTTKGLDDNRTKISKPSMVTLKALDLQGTFKVPVFNDGYFPKIQPLNKWFSMKRSK